VTAKTQKPAERTDVDMPDDEENSKDACFRQVATLANSMIGLHGKDFAMGTLVLAARFIAEDKPLVDAGRVDGPAH